MWSVKVFSRAICLASTVALLVATFPLRAAHAEIISTDTVLGSEQGSTRAHIDQFFGRSDVRREMLKLGVLPSEVDSRLSSLSDEEADQLARTIDTAHAGGDGIGVIVGAVLLVFFVLLLTDILGFTKAYPFTKSIR